MMAKPKHVKILKRGYKTWNAWRKENPEIKPELADLRLADLRLVDLKGANLHGASLSEANLEGLNWDDSQN